MIDVSVNPDGTLVYGASKGRCVSCCQVWMPVEALTRAMAVLNTDHLLKVDIFSKHDIHEVVLHKMDLFRGGESFPRLFLGKRVLSGF